MKSIAPTVPILILACRDLAAMRIRGWGFASPSASWAVPSPFGSGPPTILREIGGIVSPPLPFALPRWRERVPCAGCSSPRWRKRAPGFRWPLPPRREHAPADRCSSRAGGRTFPASGAVFRRRGSPLTTPGALSRNGGRWFPRPGRSPAVCTPHRPPESDQSPLGARRSTCLAGQPSA